MTLATTVVVSVVVYTHKKNWVPNYIILYMYKVYFILQKNRVFVCILHYVCTRVAHTHTMTHTMRSV